MLILLALTAAYFIISNDNGTLSKRGRNFKLIDTSGIEKIILKEKSDSLAIIKTNTSWRTQNDVQIKESGINKLFQILTTLKTGAPVSRERKEEIITNIKNSGIQIKIVIRGRLKKNMLACYDTAGYHNRTVMMMKGAEEPYEVYVPGFHGNLAAYFQPNPDYWIKKQLLAYDYKDIFAIAVKYFDDTANSYKIIKKEHNKFELKTPTDKKLTDISLFKSQAYFYQFNNIPFVEIPNLPDKHKQAIFSRLPFAVIAVTQTDKTIERYKIFRVQNKPSQSPKYDPHRVYVRKNNENKLFTAKYLEIDPLLKEISYFLDKND